MIIGTLSGGSSGVDIGDSIANSLRLRESNAASGTRTFGTPTSGTLWTYSVQAKRGRLTSYRVLFAGGAGTGADDALLRFSNTDALQFIQYSGGVTVGQVESTAVFRDPKKFYHVVCIYDSANATATDRIRIYVDGVRLTLVTSTQIALSAVSKINTSGYAHYFGRLSHSASQYFDGALTAQYFVDGQAVLPSGFGRVSSDTGTWVPKRYTGTYGTNGFKLDFSNGTSLTTLGYDSSGNNNHFTLSGVSLTAGPTYDWLTDTPTNTFATLNPLFPADDCTFSEGNLKFAYGSAAFPYTCFATFGMSSGEWYWTTTITANSSGSTSALIIGITNRMARIQYYPGSDANGWGYYGDSGAIYNNSSTLTTGASFGVGDVIGFKFNADTGTMRWYKQTGGSGSFALQATVSSLPAGTYYPAFGDGGGARTGAAAPNFGQQPISDTSWVGTAKALCTANMPDPTIMAGASHFQTVLATGANIKTTAEALFPAGFLEWVKDRANANNHQLLDSVRGTSAVLQSNTNAAETTYSAPSGSSVGWVWNMGSSTVTNNAGTISSQVRANVTAGQSVVTYTGTAVNATVGHGLDRAPSLILVQRRNGTTSDWQVYHSALGKDVTIQLNLTAASSSIANYWYNGVTSSVFGVNGSWPAINASGGTYVAYCFAEIPGYSKIGSYVGTGSADGPDVDCGGEVAYLVAKRTDSTGNWFVFDALRNPNNPVNLELYADQTSAEVTSVECDFTATGFKLRTTGVGLNASGGTYIFYAVLKRATKFSNAR